jgi:hypothetical protein
MEQLIKQFRVLRKIVTKTQQHIFKIQYPSTGNKDSPQQQMKIYVQKHFAKFNKDFTTSHATKIRNNSKLLLLF